MRDFTSKERRELMIPEGWKEPKIVELYIPEFVGGRRHPNRSARRRPETRAYVFHGTGNLNASADADNTADYFRRAFSYGQYYDKDGKRQTGYLEAGSMGKGTGGLGLPFRIASTHATADRRQVALSLPYDVETYNAGDRPLPWTEKYRGMKPLATELFADAEGKPRPNLYTFSIEITMYDEVRNSSVDWDESCMTARWFAVVTALEHGDDLTKIPLLRHHDITGKQCPSPFVGPPSEEEAWVKFVEATRALYMHMAAQKARRKEETKDAGDSGND